jgi:hypothetical protein
MKLVSITKSPNDKKKFRASFSNGKHTDFGDSTAQDYTQTHDKERRFQYWRRHLKDLKTEDPTRAGYLSLFILWGFSTNMEHNIQSYRSMFNL